MHFPVPGEDHPVPGTFVVPAGSPIGRGWVVLHGITRPGPRHPELLRFVRSLAGTGGRVLVPEIRDWTELRMAPERAQRILYGAIRWLHSEPGSAPGGVMVVGFSFGAPQALMAASDPELAPRLRGVVGWGGYADLHRTFRFGFTGKHDWESERYRERPDPYARWVVGINGIPLSPTLRQHHDVVQALYRLAAAAGEGRLRAGHPESDPTMAELRNELSPADRDLFDLFAPSSDREPDPEAAEALVEELVPCIRRELPLVDPLPQLRPIQTPVRLLHPRSDLLIPFTETLRLGAALRPLAPDLRVAITGLLGHSGQRSAIPVSVRAREGLRFLVALRDIFAVA